jgi:acyl-coenzyme A thioesterase PaaI-like protein
LLAGPVTYAMVDYSMGSTLWRAREHGERIATIGISINYLRTAREGDVICETVLDRRNDRVAVLRSGSTTNAAACSPPRSAASRSSPPTASARTTTARPGRRRSWRRA